MARTPKEPKAPKAACRRHLYPRARRRRPGSWWFAGRERPTHLKRAAAVLSWRHCHTRHGAHRRGVHMARQGARNGRAKWTHFFPFLAVLPQASSHASHMRRRFGQGRVALLACRAPYSSCIEQYSRTCVANLLAPWVVTPFALFLKRTDMEGCSNSRTFGGGNKCSQSRTYFRFALRWRLIENRFLLDVTPQIYERSCLLRGWTI